LKVLCQMCEIYIYFQKSVQNRSRLQVTVRKDTGRKKLDMSIHKETTAKFVCVRVCVWVGVFLQKAVITTAESLEGNSSLLLVC